MGTTSTIMLGATAVVVFKAVETTGIVAVPPENIIGIPMIAIGMKLNVAETQKLLKMYSLTELYVKLPRDSVIMYCLLNGKDIFEINEMLNDYKLELLE